MEMETPEIREDPFKRRGSRFLRRKAHIMRLWQEGKYKEALYFTRHKHARTIFELYQEDPQISRYKIAKVLGKTKQYGYQELAALRELGIPLGEKSTS